MRVRARVRERVHVAAVVVARARARAKHGDSRFAKISLIVDAPIADFRWRDERGNRRQRDTPTAWRRSLAGHSNSNRRRRSSLLE